MKHSILKKAAMAFAGGIFSLAASFSVMAATPAGALEGADSSFVYGWVWDSDDYGHVIPVEISVYASDASQALKTVTVKADHYQEKLQESIGDGYHGFQYSMDWDEFEPEQLRITAYGVTDQERVFLGELTYDKASGQPAPAGDSTQAPAPESSAKKTSSPQGPGEISISRQEPGQDSGKTSVNTQAPEQDSGKTSVNTQAPEQNLGKTFVSTQAPTQNLGRTSVSTQAPTQNLGKTSVNTQPLKQDSPKGTASSQGQAAQAPKPDTEAASASSLSKVLLSWEKGPGVAPKKEPEPEKAPVSLGMFTVTGYCSCDICCPSSVSKLTYSGTEPRAEHTVSADINVFPIGTRLMIDGTIYTVEDIGANVIENKIDIFYDTHEEALAHGTTTEEVFSVPE